MLGAELNVPAALNPVVLASASRAGQKKELYKIHSPVLTVDSAVFFSIPKQLIALFIQLARDVTSVGEVMPNT